MKSKINELFGNKKLNIPSASYINNCPINPVPYVILGDEIILLKAWLLHSFLGELTEEQHVFAYKLSMAWCTIENAFRILTAHWHIFHKPIRSSVENAERYTLACLALHNYLRLTDNAMYCPHGFVDSYNSSGNIKDGEWRSQVNGVSDNSTGMVQLRLVCGSCHREDAIALQNAFASYFNRQGDVPWQWDHVHRTSYQLLWIKKIKRHFLKLCCSF